MKATSVSPQNKKWKRQQQKEFQAPCPRNRVNARAQYRLSPELSELIESNRACSHWISVSDIDTVGLETVGPEIEWY